MKKYKVISVWPRNDHFRLNDILTIYPSGNADENKYGVEHDGNWQWIEDPHLYRDNLEEIFTDPNQLVFDNFL